MFELRVLGPIELYDGPLRIDLVGVQLAVLTHLFLHANEPVASERLAGDVWNEGQPAVKRLHVAVTRLRKALDASAGTAGCLETVTGGYRLRIPAGCSDAERFHALALEGRRELGREQPAPAREALLTALGEWRGPALSDLAYYDFAQATIRQLEEERSSATEDRFECELRLGMHQDLVGELQSWISEHPGRERPVAQLMLALYRAGCQADALATYRDAYERLAEMGIEPGTGLQHLQLSILNHAPELDLAEPAVAFKPAAPARRIPTHGRFVGRTADLAALESHLDGALAGERRVVVVSGEPGIGKTHLMAELERMALERGARVLYGGAAVGALSERTADNTLPYQPFVEALGPYVREAADALSGAGLDAQLRECARIMPFAVGASPPDPSGEPSFQRFRLFEAVVDVVVHAAEHEPTVLILDDLQSADQATHQLLRHLVRALPPARLLVVAVHRADDGLGNFLLDLQHEGAMSHLALSGLGRADAGELVRDHLPDAAVATVERLVEATSGNPLFVRELVANVRAGGANWQLAPPEELDPPESVMYLVRRRLEGFREDTVSALRVAAVIGRDFDLDTVAHCVGKPDLEVLDALEQPLEAGMINEHQSVVDRYSFSHALVRAALYQSQSRSRRRRAHLAVGRALELARECHPAELANHFWHAREVGGAEPALEHLWQAGQLADAARAWEDAERSYQRALAVLELLPAVDASRRGELELAHGHALERSGRADAARAAFRLAAATGQANDEPRLLALAALGYGRAPSSTDVADPELLALLDSALRAIGARRRRCARACSAGRPSSARRSRMARRRRGASAARPSSSPSAPATTASWPSRSRRCTGRWSRPTRSRNAVAWPGPACSSPRARTTSSGSSARGSGGSSTCSSSATSPRCSRSSTPTSASPSRCGTRAIAPTRG